MSYNKSSFISLNVCFVVCLFLFSFAFFSGCGIAQASSESKGKPKPTQTPTPTPTPMPTPTPVPTPTPTPVVGFSGGVGLFFPITPLSEDNLRSWFTPNVEKAANLGVKFVNLVVHWKDLEPQSDVYTFDMLERYMQAVTVSGLQCVLRIYFNGGWHIQACPNWLFDEKGATFCWEGDYKQPLPWDRIYLNEMTSFMNVLAVWMAADTKRQPQALQISAGGVYGEMAVLSFDWQTLYQNDYDIFYEMLTTANKAHVDVFAAFSKKLTSIPLILMINHLYDNNPAMNDLVMDYAWKTYGMRLFQSNSWSGELEEQWYGPLILDMMERHASGGVFLLEDEYGSNSETLEQRVDRIERIYFETNIRFRAVSLNLKDMTTENQANIRYLQSWTQVGVTS
jgi:hypothetical protein